MKKIITIICIIAFFVLMLCFPNETFIGASEGLLLWFQIVLPTLLPFIIISNVLVHTNAVSYISDILKPFIQKLFCVSNYGCYVILVGFMCGYPMGAKSVGDLIKSGHISKREGQYLLSFCNNTSPMFIISYIVMRNFKNDSLLMGTLCILFLAPILCSFLFRQFYGIKKERTNMRVNRKKDFSFSFQIFDTCMMDSFETITKVGGYIILFSILFVFCKKLPCTWLVATLEISNGIPYLMSMNAHFTLIFPLVLALTTFGGFCALLQTHSMIQNTGLSITHYIIQKLITALVTSFLAYIYIQFIHQ